MCPRPPFRLGLVAAFWIITLLCLGIPVGHAATITLNFEELRTVDADASHNVGPVYIHDGVRLTALPAPPPADPAARFAYAGTLSSTFAGSTMLRLQAGSGGRFNLLSMDLAEAPNFDSTGKPIGSGTFDVTFTGVRANGTEITETVTVDRFPTIDTFTFPGFADLKSVHWFQGPGGFTPGFGDHQFDNVTIRFIPEPSALWLLGFGIFILSVHRMVGRELRRRALVTSSLLQAYQPHAGKDRNARRLGSRKMLK